jgi:hypothetical protein
VQWRYDVGRGRDLMRRGVDVISMR